jgi:cation diffusion facilitator CzcD-associated flavoprotein CzcO/acetyl esterase/lipase
MPAAPEHHHVVIIGSGFAGVAAAVRLREAGFDDVVLLERADRPGGTWRDNHYPGCACDVPSRLYSLSFAPNAAWSRSFSGQPEIQRYLDGVIRDHGLAPCIRYGHEVLAARWDDATRRWHLQSAGGPFTASLLVMAGGALSDPVLPALPGLGRFRGPAFHSAQWDHGVRLDGARVAVIGTGASAIQFVPAIQPQVAQLTVFQRTPPWIVPRHDRTFTAIERAAYRHVPGLQQAARAWLYAWREVTFLAFRHVRAARLVQRLALRHLRAQVADPALRAALTPDYTIGCKRILVSNDFYPAMAQPNVTLVTAGIREITETGVITTDGVEHPADVLVFGTGFRPTDPPLAPHTIGRDGRTLAEAWGGSMRAYAGTTVHGFPNLFLIPGPNTGLGHSSMLYMIESQVAHLVGVARHLRAHGLGAVEPTAEAQARWVADVDARMRTMVWVAGGCRSWYLDASGRNSTLWPDFTFRFRRRVARLVPDDYRAVPGPSGAARVATVRPRPVDRIRALVGRTVARAPASVAVRLSGEPPVVLDGRTLDPHLQFLRASLRRLGAKGLCEPSIEAGRQRYVREALASRDAPTPVGAVHDITVDGTAGPLAARHYAPVGGAPSLLLYFHGGGFVIGDLDSHDEPCRLLCRDAGTHVLSVAYRLAPEHPFPAALEDALAATRWARANAARFGVAPDRIAVGGDSAGGNLAAGVARELAATGVRLAAQLLIYPAVDTGAHRPSHARFGDGGFFLTSRDIRAFSACYLQGVTTSLDDPRLAPVRAPWLGGLPTALVVTAGFDPLRDDGEAYADALEAAGTTVARVRCPSMGHGFLHMSSVSPGAARALWEVASAWRTLAAVPERSHPLEPVAS